MSAVARNRDWSFVRVADVVADAVGDRPMLVCGDTRRTYAEVRERSGAFARYLAARAIGRHRPHADLAPHELGQDTVALILHNGVEYIEAMYGAWRAGAVPFNVNQHYRPAELGALLADLAPRVIVYHGAYAALVEACAEPAMLLVRVDDGDTDGVVPGSVGYEDALDEGRRLDTELPATSPDDAYVVCTGGTTGRPKAVLWRQGDAYVGAMAGAEDATAESIASGALNWSSGPWYAVPPLMHAAAQWTAFSGLHLGATVLLHDDRGAFDAAAVLRRAETEGAFMMTLVGDAYARPLVEQLEHRRHDLSGLRVIGTGGAATSADLKDALTRLVPGVVVRDGYGASETGGMAFDSHVVGSPRSRYAGVTGATVLSEDRTRVLEPGDTEIGWIARRGRVPRGYLGDPERTASTFPVVDGIRHAVPGDRGRLAEDGTIVLVGRDALVVNTGGEKVYVEEVEEILRAHEGIVDTLVVGRPSERFGNEVVAVVATRDDALDAPGVRAHVAAHLARYKAPRAVAFVDDVVRLANGKGDYVWAAEAARHASDATGGT